MAKPSGFTTQGAVIHGEMWAALWFYVDKLCERERNSIIES